MRRLALLGVAVVGTLALTACGNGDDAMSDSAREQLAPMTARVRSALDSFDPAGAAIAVADVRHATERLHEQGEIGDGRAVEILAAVARVERRLDLAPTTTTSTTTTTTRPPASEDNGGRTKNGDEKGKGKARGHDEG